MLPSATQGLVTPPGGGEIMLLQARRCKVQLGAIKHGRPGSIMVTSLLVTRCLHGHGGCENGGCRGTVVGVVALAVEVLSVEAWGREGGGNSGFGVAMMGWGQNGNCCHFHMATSASHKKCSSLLL